MAATADFTIVTADGKGFPCHRSWLGLASAYFEAMFGIGQPQQNRVVVPFDETVNFL